MTTKKTKTTFYKKFIAGKETTYALLLLAGTFGAMLLSPEFALALPEGPKNLKEVAKTVQDEVQGSGLTIALNGTGVAAIAYSIFNGFNKAFLVAGALILAFANLFFAYVNGGFKIN